MKSGAKMLVKTQPNTKIVRVHNTGEGEANECWANAILHSDKTGSTVYSGWLVGDAKQSLNPKAKAICIRHYFNRLHGQWIDTTPLEVFNDFTYVVVKTPRSEGWLTAENESEHILYI